MKIVEPLHTATACLETLRKTLRWWQLKSRAELLLAPYLAANRRLTNSTAPPLPFNRSQLLTAMKALVSPAQKEEMVALSNTQCVLDDKLRHGTHRVKLQIGTSTGSTTCDELVMLARAWETGVVAVLLTADASRIFESKDEDEAPVRVEARAIRFSSIAKYVNRGQSVTELVAALHAATPKVAPKKRKRGRPKKPVTAPVASRSGMKPRPRPRARKTRSATKANPSRKGSMTAQKVASVVTWEQRRGDDTIAPPMPGTLF